MRKDSLMAGHEMGEPKDQEVEDRAKSLAKEDKLEWVELPQQKGDPEKPAAATNAERDGYRDEAREQIKQERDGSKP